MCLTAQYTNFGLLLKRVDLAVDPAIEAVNLAAAYCFCFLKCLNCCSIRLFLHHAFRHSLASIMLSSGWFLSGAMRVDGALRRVARSSRHLNRCVD
jgi:hypothetical protein